MNDYVTPEEAHRESGTVSGMRDDDGSYTACPMCRNTEAFPVIAYLSGDAPAKREVLESLCVPHQRAFARISDRFLSELGARAPR